jgi:hypothetical protein
MVVKIVEQPGTDQAERLEESERDQQQDEIREKLSEHSEIALGSGAAPSLAGS